VDGISNRYAYLGDGGRISVTVGSETITYTLELAAPLVQVLVANEDGDSTRYLYGVARIGEDDGTWRYHLADHLGSVRSLVDANSSVDGTRAYQPYGASLDTVGTASSIYGFTGEQTDPTALVYLRARYYGPRTRQFVSRDLWRGTMRHPGMFNGFNYVGANPVNRTDPLGLIYRTGTIENVVYPTPLFSFFGGSFGPATWLGKAVTVEPVNRVYDSFVGQLGIWRSLTSLFVAVRQLAKEELDRTPNCLNTHEKYLEANHIALIVLAEPPGNHDAQGRMVRWQQYPLFMPDDRINEPGWDKTGHFFVTAFLAFETRYIDAYAFKTPIPSDVLGAAAHLEAIVGTRSIEAIEQDYRLNQDPVAGYVDTGGLSGFDSYIFDSLAVLGNVYELLTSLKHLRPETCRATLPGISTDCSPQSLLKLFMWARGTGRGYLIDQLTDLLLAQAKQDLRNEGLLDSGIYRDFTANRLGARFGLALFNNPAFAFTAH